jgi:hypothetical protein
MNVKVFIHYLILINLITGYLSSLYMVFFVYRIKGSGVGPMWMKAKDVPHEFFVQRRMYALESWIIFACLAIYFGITSLPGFSLN